MISESCIKILEYDKIKNILAAHTLTLLGKNLAVNLRPDTQDTIIKHNLALTQEATRLLGLEKDLPIAGTRDLTALLKRVQIGIVAEANEFLAVYNTLLAAAAVKKYLGAEDSEHPLLNAIAQNIGVFAQLEKSIAQTIDDNGTVKDDASRELHSLRSRIVIYKNRIREKLEDILRSADNQKYFQEQLVTMRGDRYVIPIKQEYRQFFPGVIHDQSSSGATVFIEPIGIVNINNDIKKLLLDERQEVERILTALSKAVAQAASELTLTLSTLAAIDLIFAKARMGIKMRATCPNIRTGGGINILKGRHPLIAPDKVVALDIAFDPKVQTLLITGPNTGGKTVSLKLVGLFVLMCQSGLFIPASEYSELPIFRQVFADIGDEQSIEQSLSTFSGHMHNIIDILSQVESQSLVLLDELCAGTDPSEGAALAIAILLKLQELGALTMVTTHYNELKVFALSHEHMLNASVEFDNVSLSPKYSLIMGVAGSSNAFYISKRLGLGEDIIASAQSFLNREQERFNLALRDLEQEKRTLADNNKYIAQVREESRRLRLQLDNEREALKKREQLILDKAREEADNIKRRAKREVESIIEEIKQLDKEKNQQVKIDKIKQARASLSNEWVVATPQDTDGIPLTLAAAAVGQSVFVKTLGQTGKIIDLKGSDIQVQIGVLKTYVKMTDCLLIKESKKSKEAGKLRTLSNNTLIKLKNFQAQIDIRGMNVQEATTELDKYIDDALMVNMKQVRIIHGKGTGLLKKGIEEYLHSHPAVSDFKEAPLTEGGAGATIVYL